MGNPDDLLISKVAWEADLARLEQAKAQLDEAQAKVADLEAKLAACEEGETPPAPEPAGTLWGMGSFRILPTNTSHELDPLRGKTAAQSFDILDADFARRAGKATPFMDAVRVYSTGFPSTFAQHDAAMVTSRPGLVAVASVKGSDSTMASGGFDAQVASFVRSCPSDRPTYLGWNHERDNDTDALANPAAVMGVHNRALARFAAVILAERGTLEVYPYCCPTGWNLQDQNKTYPRDVLNPAGELEKVGVDLDEFVYLSDTYYRKPPTAEAVTTIHLPIVKRVKGWGFNRVGFGEVGVDSYSTANSAPAAAYLEAWAAMCKAEAIEVLTWYESGGGNSAPPNGWWIYGDPAKDAWANAVAGSTGT